MTREPGGVRVCSLAGDLGFGFPPESLERALRLKPHVIALQGTSADPGPYYLGAGESWYTLGGIRRDLELLLPAAKKARIPVVTSAGGAGAKVQVDPVVATVADVARRRALSLRTAVIRADVSPAHLKRRIAQGAEIKPVVDWPTLSDPLRLADIARSVRIVAQMGPEPIMRVLQDDIDLVVAGRTVDVSLFTALPLLRGCDPGLATHMAKILECGAMAAVPSTGADGLIGTLYDDHFTVEPLSLERRCTVRSVAGHSFYERADPYIDHLPGGLLDTSEAIYTQVDERTVRVSGSRWLPATPYTVKVEGAEQVGYRTVCLAGIRDSIMIEQIDGILDGARRDLATRFGLEGKDYHLTFRVYGRDGVMGAAEPERHRLSHELFLIMDVVAESQPLAREVCAFGRAYVLHTEFPGCRTSAGNLAFPFSPSEVSVGPVYRFNIWHLLPVDDPVKLFPVEIHTFGRRRSRT